MPRTIEMKDVTDALQCSERNIREREGKSFPPAVSDRPRVYVLSDVLWWVNGQERAIILQAIGVSVKSMQRAMASVTDAPRYSIPRSSALEEHEADPLMQ